MNSLENLRVMGIDPGLTRCGVAVVDGAQTRDVLGLALAATLNAPIPEHPRFGVFRM